MAIKLSTEQLLKVVALLREKKCETLEEAETIIVRKSLVFEDKKNEYCIFDLTAKNDFLIKNLIYTVIDEPFFPYEKITKICYSDKNKRVTFYTSDSEVISKKEDEVVFDLNGVKGKDFFKFII